MKYAFACTAALAVGALVGTAAPAAAGDTVRLGGVGSLSSYLDDSAAVRTLRGDPAQDEDDTLLVAAPVPRGGFAAGRGAVAMPRGGAFAGAHAARPATLPAYRPNYGYRPGYGYAGSGYRPAYGHYPGYGYGRYPGYGYGRYPGYGYRPGYGYYPGYGYGRYAGYGYRPWYGYYRPWYGYGYYRPWYGNSFFLSIGGLGWGWGWPYYAGYSAPYYSSYAVSYPVTSYYSSTVIEPTVTLPVGGEVVTTPAVPPAPEVGPAPVPNEPYRYDGGPARPVPMPPATVEPPAAPPVGVIQTKAGPAKAKLTYPAYGDDRPARPAPGNTRLVKSSE